MRSRKRKSSRRTVYNESARAGVTWNESVDGSEPNKVEEVRKIKITGDKGRKKNIPILNFSRRNVNTYGGKRYLKAFMR